MISLNETVRSLYGALRLARFDSEGLNFFNQTIPGFWRSFFAAVLVFPPYLIVLLLRHQGAYGDVSALRFYSIEILAYVIAWLAFPVVMISIAAAIDRQRFFVRYIVAYNWAGVLQNALYLPVVILTLAGGLGESASGTLSLAILGWVLAYGWFITRTALDIPASAAAGIVGLDFLLSILINVITGRSL